MNKATEGVPTQIGNDDKFLIARDTFVQLLWQAFHHGGSEVDGIPGLLKRVIREDSWRKRIVRTGKVVEFDNFEEFVTTPPLKGLGGTLEDLVKFCKVDQEALNLIDQVTGNHQGKRNDLVDNVNEVLERPAGNTKQYAIRKLRKDRPDLHARVMAEEITPHAAMVEAGFRKKSTPLEQLRKAWKKATPDEREAFMAEIENL